MFNGAQISEVEYFDYSIQRLLLHIYAFIIIIIVISTAIIIMMIIVIIIIIFIVVQCHILCTVYEIYVPHYDINY